MKNLQFNFLGIKTFWSLLFCSLLCFTCACQTEKDVTQVKFVPKKTKIHEDSISMNAATLPEFRVDVHDKDYQGNQISGVVRTVFQDRKGNFWFGTQNGLCRYDNKGFVYFELKDLNDQGVTVHVILEDKSGNIWIGYGGGIAKYDGEYFTNYHEKNILTKGGLWSMAMDKKGTLWVGTTQGIFTFDGNAFTAFDIPEGKVDPSKGISTTKMIHSIFEDSKNNMWFATNGGAYMYDGKKLTNISEKDGLGSDFVNQIIEGVNGKYWISTSHGLFQYDGNSILNVTEKLLGKNEGVGCIFEDKNGTLWFTANKRAIYSYKDTTFQKFQIKEGDFGPMPFQIYQDQQERLWFVGFKGAYRLDNNTFVNITRNWPWIF